jgi:hypothetical protein
MGNEVGDSLGARPARRKPTSLWERLYAPTEREADRSVAA